MKAIKTPKPLQSFGTFAKETNISEQTISTWYNREIHDLGGKKQYMEFIFTHEKYGFELTFHVIDGHRFVEQNTDLIFDGKKFVNDKD